MLSESLIKLLEGIRKQVIAGEVQDALDQLQNYLAGSGTRVNREVSLIASRYNRLSRDLRTGTITRDVAQAEQTKLINDFLEVLGHVPTSVTAEMLPVAGPALPEWASELSEESQPETVLHVNVLKQVSWIQRAIEVSRSVCRVLTPKGVGTGFLISPTLLMTNNHVIPTTEIAEQTLIEFNYEQDLNGKFLQTYRYSLDTDVFATSPVTALDYTIVGVKADPRLPQPADWGHLDLNPFADPVISEHVVIIQHPNGGLKQIALTANQVVKVKSPYILYNTDTMPGSSGAPVFNDLWQVIALHHAGVSEKNSVSRFANEGILISAIKADAGPSWPTTT